RPHQPFQFPGLHPHPLGFVATIPHPLEGPQHPRPTGHQAECPMSVDPAITVAITPRPIRVQAVQSFGNDPLHLLFTMPDRSSGLHHHLVRTDDFIASIPEERFDTCILHLFQAQSRFFLSAPASDSPRWARHGPPSHTAPSNSACSVGESPHRSSP